MKISRMQLLVLLLVFAALLVVARTAANAPLVVIQDVPAEYKLDDNYTLLVSTLEFSNINKALQLKVVTTNGNATKAALLTATGTPKVYRANDADDETYTAYAVLIDNTGRADPCMIYIPKNGTDPVLATCR